MEVTIFQARLILNNLKRRVRFSLSLYDYAIENKIPENAITNSNVAVSQTGTAIPRIKVPKQVDKLILVPYFFDNYVGDYQLNIYSNHTIKITKT